jgi:hypothetical protein
VIASLSKVLFIHHGLKYLKIGLRRKSQEALIHAVCIIFADVPQVQAVRCTLAAAPRISATSHVDCSENGIEFFETSVSGLYTDRSGLARQFSNVVGFCELQKSALGDKLGISARFCIDGNVSSLQ